MRSAIAQLHVINRMMRRCIKLPFVVTVIPGDFVYEESRDLARHGLQHYANAVLEKHCNFGFFITKVKHNNWSIGKSLSLG